MYRFWSMVRSLQMQRADYMHQPTPFYIGKLSIHKWWSWNKSLDTKWLNIFEESKVICRLLAAQMGQFPNLWLFKGHLYTFFFLWMENIKGAFRDHILKYFSVYFHKRYSLLKMTLISLSYLIKFKIIF